MNYKTYEERQKELCENCDSKGGNIINPSCIDGKKEYRVEVIYNEVESDTFLLCKECRDNIKKDCRKWGYKVRTKKLQ